MTIPAAPHMTLLEWIELDDGDTPSTLPACNVKTQTLHARVLATSGGNGEPFERLQPPPGLHLAPLG